MSNSDEVSLKKGQITPDFTLNTLEGETVKLSDFRGDPVIVNFWATWCHHVEQRSLIFNKFMKIRMWRYWLKISPHQDIVWKV
ncbi:peroxiredoxin family protein [Virgibacillus salexigens]|uniref:peroxiredoxin family protein n=1 Tax=Virgibacillus salexigens TaxID=61016 RepID=UPI002279D445|nr:TlpA disulfide reductase family protein [Virgibacillus salexigens]